MKDCKEKYDVEDFGVVTSTWNSLVAKEVKVLQPLPVKKKREISVQA